MVAAKGSLVLWRSRAVHCNYRGDPQYYEHYVGGAGKPRRAPDTAFARLMQTVCYCPSAVRAADVAAVAAAVAAAAAAEGQ